jgi:hypothetical protein
MIGNLQTELKAFRVRAPTDPNIRLILPPGYDPSAKRAPTQLRRTPEMGSSRALPPKGGAGRAELLW